MRIYRPEELEALLSDCGFSEGADPSRAGTDHLCHRRQAIKTKEVF